MSTNSKAKSLRALLDINTVSTTYKAVTHRSIVPNNYIKVAIKENPVKQQYPACVFDLRPTISMMLLMCISISK